MYEQEIYNAVKRSIGNCDVDSAVREAMRDTNIGFHIERIANDFINVAYEQSRPSTLLRPKLTIDGNSWCALYGDNLQDGVAGFGYSPAQAFDDFDRNWVKKLEGGNGSE